jgi:hypothetical protein
MNILIARNSATARGIFRPARRRATEAWSPPHFPAW